ncbi:MAG: DUF4079 family protein [Oscillatoriales cyanobacterium]|nr:MAG: DUF4079 family protein [Oscillatoriales cyanobacterium]
MNLPSFLWLWKIAAWSGMATLVILLLLIGVVGTLGYYGNLGHSAHLSAGLAVVALVLVSVGSGLQIGPKNPWARPLHIGTNLVLFAGFAIVLLTGWTIVQKYLPKV